MAANLSNLIVPSVFGGYVQAEFDKMNAFVRSGAAVTTPALSALMAGGANTFNIPFWKQISASTLVPSTDYETAAAVQKMSAGVMKGTRVQRALTPIAVTDLEATLIGDDPVAEAVRQIAQAHDTSRNSILVGILGAVTAVDSADAGTEADLTFTDAGTSLSGAMLAEAVATKWGDGYRGLAGLTLVMNALEFLDLQKLNIAATGIAFPNAVDVGFGTFMGATIIVDDAVANNTVYIIKRGGLAYAPASVAVPFEMERKPGAGNGGGADVVYSRVAYCYHVAGSSFTGTPAGELATDAELANVANWSLVYDKKLCGVLKVSHS